jgi:hypothetical protein
MTRTKIPGQSGTAAWILIALYLLGFTISAASRSQSDLIIYRNAGIQAGHAGEIYNSRDPSPFQYAPVYAVAFIPFGLLPLRPAQLAWFVISMALALPAMILGTSRLLFGRGFEMRWDLIVVPVLALYTIHPSQFRSWPDQSASTGDDSVGARACE